MASVDQVVHQNIKIPLQVSEAYSWFARLFGGFHSSNGSGREGSRGVERRAKVVAQEDDTVMVVEEERGGGGALSVTAVLTTIKNGN